MILRALLALWTSVARPMGDHLWQSTLFLAMAAILALALRKNQARVRYWVWLTASVKFLIPFSLLIAFGSHLAKPRVSTPTQAVVYSTVEDLSQPFAGPESPLISQAPAPVSRFQLLPPIIVAVWLAGLVAVLLVWATGWIRVSLMVRRAVRLERGPEAEALRRLESSLGVRKPIKLVLSRNWMEPGIFGIVRQVLIWPEGISQHLDDRHIEAILAHEVCHVRRHDNLTAVLHMLVEAVFWFHPLVWWMGARLEEERERACDEEVSLLCRQPHVYAESILRVCKFCSESPLACVSGITGADLKRRIVQIMTKRVALKLDLRRKLLLLAAAAAAVAAPLALGLAHRPLVFGQILHADGPLPSFEVATIKPDKPSQGLWVQPPENIWRTWGTTARGLVSKAYGVPATDTRLQVLGGPDWIDSDKYDIEAEIPAALVAEREKMDPRLRTNQAMLMVQSLLAERFKLKIHFETREMPIYELVVTKGGPKLTASKEAPPEPGSRPPNPGRPVVPPLRQGMRITSGGRGVNQMTVKGETLDEWTQSSPFGGPDAHPIVNKTGLTGRYDFTLNWAVDPLAAPAAGGQGGVPPTDAPSLSVALQEQLGLKLVKAKGPVEVIVIDHIERPDLDDAGFAEPRRAPTPSSSPSVAPVPMAQKKAAGAAPALAAGGAVSAPVLIYSVEPEFTESARKAKASGDVLVKLWVDEEGNPEQVRTVRGLGFGLNEKAVEAVKQYRYTPAMEYGKPVPTQLNVAVKFQVF